jgi:hypothetical protein
MTDWRPISEAPKDRTLVLGYWKKDDLICIGYFSPGGHWIDDHLDQVSWENPPDYWQAMPESPRETK